MIQFLAPLAVISAAGGITHSLLRGAWRNTRSRKAAGFRRRLSAAEVRACVSEFGMSNNSFMTLYPGFEYFAHPDASIRGTIAFIETSGTWVGGAEPFCAPEHRTTFLTAFAAAAMALDKVALLLPVDEKIAEASLLAGYRAVMIGSEPTFNLEKYPRTGRTWTDVVPTAKNLAGKGAKVSEFSPAALTEAQRAELDGITAEWLGTRKMDALGFLNQVDPWFLAEDKRYFRIEHGGRTLAFLAAIPVWARNSWYLIDLLRRSDTPPGTTELLYLQAMRLLRESGAREATMGVAPFSLIETAGKYPCGEPEINRRTYWVLKQVYEKGNALYNFKPLYQYKLKFDPSTSPPAFLIYKPKLGLLTLLSMSQAFLPAGMARASWSGAVRMVTRFDLADWIRHQLTASTVVRSAPPSWSRLLRRCKLTVTLIVFNLAAYFVTVDSSGQIDPVIEQAWGFSWISFLSHPIASLLIPPFLHWNLSHLCLNLLILVIFTGGLEYLAGSGITALAYFIPMLLSNPLTALTAARIYHPNEVDVGASIGIFGCGGALSWFVRWGKWLVIGLAAGTAMASALNHSSMMLNHLVAVALGLIIGRWAL